MKSDQAAVLLQVFPVLMLAAVIESRRVHKRIRLRRFYRLLVITELAAGVIALAICFRGVVDDGVQWSLGQTVNLCFYVVSFGLVLQLIMIIATQEIEDEAGQTPESIAREREDDAVLRALSARRRSRRRWRLRRKGSSTSR